MVGVVEVAAVIEVVDVVGVVNGVDLEVCCRRRANGMTCFARFSSHFVGSHPAFGALSYIISLHNIASAYGVSMLYLAQLPTQHPQAPKFRACYRPLGVEDSATEFRGWYVMGEVHDHSRERGGE